MLDSLVGTGDLSAAGRRKLLERLDGGADADRPKNLDDVRWLYQLMHRLGSFEHARAVAARQADEAAGVLASLDWFPASHHRDVLTELVDYVHGRTR
jgi:geranylgeranyl diphosphate synthase type II